ncbi:MAG: hypothetical protein ACOYWZ_23825 [Bacillota bacterium]
MNTNNIPDSIKKRKRQTLTPREKRLLKFLPTANSISEAMRKAGYSESVVNSGERLRLLQKVTIQEKMRELGLTDECFLNTLKEGLQAKKVISAMVVAPSGEGMKDANSMTRDFVEVDDYDCRHKYLVTGLRLHGHLNEKNNDGDVTFNIQVNHFHSKSNDK